MLRQKHICIIITLSLTIAVLLPALFVYYVDPFQIYHRSRYPNMGLSDNQRFQNAGLINSYLADPAEGYDSVMIGSSLSDNFTSEDAQHYLGWKKTLRLFIDGGDPKELLLLSLHATAKKNVRYVLWEIRRGTYSANLNDLVLDPAVFPDYIYNHHIYDDFRYLFNRDILAQAYRAFRGDIFPFQPDNIGFWAEDKAVVTQHEKFNSTQNLLILDQQTIEFRQSREIPLIMYQSFPVVDDELLPAINKFCNKNIEIIFYIPPTTKLNSQALGTPSVYLPRYILEKIQPCQNFSLHAFDLEDFSNDLNNYKDIEHYMPNISKTLLQLIGKKSNALTPDNIDEYETEFLKAVNEYRVYSSYNERAAAQP